MGKTISIMSEPFLPDLDAKIAALDAALQLAFEEGYDIEIDDLLEQRYALQKWIDWRAQAAMRHLQPIRREDES
jgi:hypothetical protein